MKELLELFSLCKASVTIEYNGHKDYYQSVEQHIDDWGNGDDKKHILPEVLEGMIARDTITAIQFYPNTPIGFYRLWHYDLELAVKECLEIIKSERDATNKTHSN